MPSFTEIADDLAARIAAGEWAWRGDVPTKLPSSKRLAAEYSVSEATAYRALVLLTDRGLIYGEAGRGRYVKRVQ
jgi:DNA-binding GntR family transcriptional regulator